MAASLKEGEIEELKSRADIQTIVSGYVKLKKTGKNYSGLCPFHKEKTPSFTVDSRKQLYHCFGCGEGGDVISFIMKMENLEFIDAVEFLANKVNYNLKYTDAGSPEKTQKKGRLVEINELAARYYNYILFNSRTAAHALSYLEKRGFTKETLEKFEVGFSPKEWNKFCDFAAKKQFTQKEILDSGLAIQSDRAGGDIYDRFRGRIMFPIRDIVGRVVGFGGRITEENKIDARRTAAPGTSVPLKAAKYINTPETRIYSKSKNIYGLFNSKKSIVDQDRVLIVEGYTDVMALHQAGINNAVASLGTALTTEQVEIIGRFTKNIVLLFDSDAAGESASMRGIERLKEYNEKLDLFHESNIDMRVAILEQGYDPSDYMMKKGREAFMEKINGSISMIDFTIGMVLKKYNIENMNEKLRATGELVEFISSLSSKIVQEECIKKISGKLNLRESLLIEQLLKKMRQKAATPFAAVRNADGIPQQQEGISPAKIIEIEALKILVNGIGRKFFDLLEIGEEYFKFDDTRAIYNIIRNMAGKASGKGPILNFPLEISSDRLEDESLKKLCNLVVFSPLNYSDYDLASEEIYFNLKKIFVSDRIEQVRQLLKKYENFKKNLNKEEADKEQLLKLEKAENKIKMLTLRLSELEAEKRSFN